MVQTESQSANDQSKSVVKVAEQQIDGGKEHYCIICKGSQTTEITEIKQHIFIVEKAMPKNHFYSI